MFTLSCHSPANTTHPWKQRIRVIHSYTEKGNKSVQVHSLASMQAKRKMWLCKNLHEHVWNGFISTCQSLEVIKMTFNRRMENKLWQIHTMEYYSIIISKWDFKALKLCILPTYMHIAKSTKLICMSPITFTGRQKYGDCKKKSVPQKLGRRATTRWSCSE